MISWRIELNLLHVFQVDAENSVHLLLASAVFSSLSSVQCMSGLAELKLVRCFKAKAKSALSKIYIVLV